MKLKRINIIYLFTCLTMSLGLCFSSFSTYHQKSNSSILISQYTFAITLQPSANNSLISYWIVGVVNDNITMKYPVTETNFILQMQGKQTSKANPERINLFDKIEMDSCFYLFHQKGIPCNLLDLYKLDDLWTLRYNRNPTCPEGCIQADGMRIEGLAANKTFPSPAQNEILKEYNVNNYTDFFYGENMLKIFSDINDPNWISNYQAAK